LEKLLHETIGVNWQWQLHSTDEDSKLVSLIDTELKNVSVLNAVIGRPSFPS